MLLSAEGLLTKRSKEAPSRPCRDPFEVPRSLFDRDREPGVEFSSWYAVGTIVLCCFRLASFWVAP